MQATDNRHCDLATNDLGPLAWVLDELRKSLDSASAALRRFVRDTGAGARLRHGLGRRRPAAHRAPAAAPGRRRAARWSAWPRRRTCCAAMEAAVQKFVERPELCTEAGGRQGRARRLRADRIPGRRAAGQAGVGGRAVPAVPRRAGTGRRRPHPSGRPVGHGLALDRTEHAPDADARWSTTRPCARAWTRRVLQRRQDRRRRRPRASCAQVSLALAAAQAARQPQDLLEVCAGFFEAMALGLLPLDIYVKRAASRVLLQYATLAKGELRRLRPAGAGPACSSARRPCRRARRGAALHGGARWPGAWRASAPVDYQTAQFGRFDPVLLAQARKRIDAAKETWSALSGGDASKLKGVADQFRPGQRLAAQAASGQRAAGAGADQRRSTRRALRPAARRRTGDGSRDRGALPGSRLPGPGSGRRAAGRAHRAAGRAARRGAPGRPARAARALDGGAVPPRQRPPDHGQRGRRTARHPGRARKVARPVLPRSAGQGAAARRARPPVADARRAVGAGPGPGGAGRAAHARDGRGDHRHRDRRGAGATRPAPSTSSATTWARSAS